jgi:hypothetical protein
MTEGQTVTKHASIRSHQRAIPPLVVDLLHQFGSMERTGTGTFKLFFDKTGRRRVKSYAGPLSRPLEEHLDAYVVVDDAGGLITVGHRTQRIRRQ